MDNPPRESRNDIQRNIQEKHTNDNIDGGYIFSATWLRCIVRSNHALDRVFLGYGCNFLLYISIILWALFLLN
jgi:hypothetical protein